MQFLLSIESPLMFWFSASGGFLSVVRFFIGAVRLIQAEKRFFAGGALFRAAAGTAHAGVILLAVLQRLHRMRCVLIAVIAAVFGQIILYDSVAGNLRGACVYSALVIEEAEVCGQRAHVGEFLAVRRPFHCAGQNIADIFLLRAEFQQLGEFAVRNDLPPLFLFIGLQQARGGVQVGKLLMEMLFPDFFTGRSVSSLKHDQYR